jgi:L-lactate dehydrogenase complex protein LldG
MSSRDQILHSIRSQALTSEPLPELDAGGVRFDDPMAKFCEVLAMVGGRGIHVATLAEAQQALLEIPHYQTAKLRVSACTGVGETNFDAAAVADPHDFEAVDFAVLPALLACAENAAVWVTDEQVPHRVLFFLTQHLALVVPSRSLVHNLGEAYPRIDVQAARFSAWISGPSKTADIEQSLVIGAHGPRSLTVFLVDELPG